MKMSLLALLIMAMNMAVAQGGQWYVNPSAVANGAGTLVSPFDDIPEAIDFAAANGGGEVIVTNGVHVLTRSQRILTAATAADSVIIRPESPYGVRFEFGVRSAFYFEVGSRYITLQGFEIDGKTYENDFWCVVAQDFWSEDGNPDGGGLAVIADGEHINVFDNYIHDCYQKGVEIADGRYIRVQGNLISNIAQYSLSGGHGIMRQQAGDLEYDDPDDPNTYRWDLHGNLIYNIEQRIYSWVPRKGFIEMVIDEGKSILIDDPKNTNGTQDQMTARIKNNVVAFGVVDHIRLKSTPGLEVSNNSIYSEGENGDGITDKGADDNPGGANTLFTNFTAHGNAVQTVAGIFAFEIDHCLGESYGTGNDPQGNTPAGAVTNNYVAVGRYKPRNETNVDVTDLGAVQLFVNPNGGNFTLNPALNLPAGVGVDPVILTELNNRATSFGAPIGNDGWITDHLKLSQTILDNIPGLNDGIPGNETVLTDAGVMDATYEHIYFDVVDGSWKAARNSPSEQEFALHPKYTEWYANTIAAFPNATGGAYERLRWGDSEVKQDQVFDPDWLTHSQINNSGNTLINGYDNNFVLNGDLLVEFDGVTPNIGDSYDLMEAGSITAENQDGTYFDRVLFDGFTPESYSLEVVSVGSGREVLRLTILMVLPVELTTFTAEPFDKQVLLKWTTVSETTNDFFAIERSQDATAWTELGRVHGMGNYAGTSAYRYHDRAPLLGQNFYRLRQVDFDGRYSYSPIKQVTFDQPEQTLLAYPNPSGGTITLAELDGATHIEVFDAAGKRVLSKVLEREVDSYKLSLQQLTPGTYLIRVASKTTSVVLR